MIETDLFEFAYVPDWYGQLEQLAEMALPEAWRFRKPQTECKNTDTPILERYLHMIFRKLSIDYNTGETAYFHVENNCACFHTGLYTRQYQAIYACFERNKKKDTTLKWYFTGFCEADGNPDIGDSAITETVGVGGMSMIAAPGVTRFVGAGGFEDALRVSNEMQQICITHNPNFVIPTWDFKGSPLGIDIRKVVATGITPLINTGIAHKVAGIGQVGAGTVRAPLGCFEKALEAYAKKLGIE